MTDISLTKVASGLGKATPSIRPSELYEREREREWHKCGCVSIHIPSRVKEVDAKVDIVSLLTLTDVLHISHTHTHYYQSQDTLNVFRQVPLALQGHPLQEGTPTSRANHSLRGSPYLNCGYVERKWNSMHWQHNSLVLAILTERGRGRHRVIKSTERLNSPTKMRKFWTSASLGTDDTCL